MHNHTCKDCRFWESGTNIGTCRRHAPAAGPHIHGEDAQAMWPRTEDKDWCADLELRPAHPHESMEAYFRHVKERERQDREAQHIPDARPMDLENHRKLLLERHKLTCSSFKGFGCDCGLATSAGSQAQQ